MGILFSSPSIYKAVSLDGIVMKGIGTGVKTIGTYNSDLSNCTFDSLNGSLDVNGGFVALRNVTINAAGLTFPPKTVPSRA